MTPKERANDLLSKMWMSSSTIEDARECALIAVDEIMKIEYWTSMPMGGRQEEEYWKQIRNELKKL